MVRDAHDPLADGPVPAPPMLGRPADAPPPPGRVGDSAPVLSLRRVLTDRRTGTRRSFRAWAARVSGRADRRLLLALADATDAVAAQSDLLVERLTAQEALTADVVGAFGQELALLRAEVAHLQRTVTALQDPGV